jgi:hypothetical protein
LTARFLDFNDDERTTLASAELATMAKTMEAAVPVTPAFEESSFDLLSLAELITTRAHLLAPGNSDEALYALATSVVKASCDRGMSALRLACTAS